MMKKMMIWRAGMIGLFAVASLPLLSATVMAQEKPAEKKIVETKIEKRQETLKKLFIDGKLSGDQYNEAKKLLVVDPRRLSAPQLHRKQAYIDLADGKLPPQYLATALAYADKQTKKPVVDAATQPAENLKPIEISTKATAQGREFIFSRFPINQREFMALYEKVGKTPDGAASMMVIALNMYVADPSKERRKMIEGCIAGIVTETYAYRGGVGNSVKYGLDILTRPNKRFIPWSYIKGTSRAKYYYLPNPPYRIEFYTDPKNNRWVQQGYFKMFIDSSGADRDRPVTMKKEKDGFYRIMESSSLWVDINTREFPRSILMDRNYQP